MLCVLIRLMCEEEFEGLVSRLSTQPLFEKQRHEEEDLNSVCEEGDWVWLSHSSSSFCVDETVLLSRQLTDSQLAHTTTVKKDPKRLLKKSPDQLTLEEIRYIHSVPMCLNSYTQATSFCQCTTESVLCCKFKGGCIYTHTHNTYIPSAVD